jgi:hypothetical protein
MANKQTTFHNKNINNDFCIAKFSSYFDLKNMISTSTNDFMEQMFQICYRFQIRKIPNHQIYDKFQ